MKKNIVLLIIAIVCGSMFFSCKPNTEKNYGKKGSSGKTLELMLVADKNVYSGATKALFDSLYARPMEGSFWGEPIFDIANIMPEAFRGESMFEAHRNIIILEIKDDNPNKVYRHVDYWSSPQVVYEFACKDRHSLDSLLAVCNEKVVEDFRNNEHLRVIKAFSSIKGVAIMNQLKEHFGFSLLFSDEFEMANLDGDFAWVRKEAKDFGLGILIQRLPYKNQNQFSEKEILRNIDSSMAKVPGPADGSYMATDQRLDCATKHVTLAGQYAVETRGIWTVIGDFMGGPYVNYTVVAPDNKYLLLLTAYTYSPRATNQMPYPKRDHLMQMEGVCWSLDFNN